MKVKTVCSICKKEVKSNYCGNCGQKIGKQEITILGVVSDVFSNYFSFEKSGLATIFTILKKPKFIVENYCMGNKGYYFSPGKMLIFSIIVLVLHSAFIDSEKIMGVSFSFGNFKAEYGYWLILLTFLTIISQFTFIRQGANLSKHIVSITYFSTTFFIILTILSDLLYSVFGDFLVGELFIIYLILIFAWNAFALSKKRTVWIYLLNFMIQLTLFASVMYVLIVFVSDSSK